MHEHHRHVADKKNASTRALGECKRHHSLDALADINEFSELIRRVTVETASPVVVGQYQVIEPDALLMHVYKPHAHRARPGHQSDELVTV